MISLDYYNLILRQLPEVNRSRRRLSFIHTSFGKWIHSLFSPESYFKRVNRITTSQLTNSRKILAEIKEQEANIQNKDLSKEIRSVNRLLQVNIKLHAIIIDLLANDKNNEFSVLTISKKSLDENIDILYSITRILKKANDKKAKATSQLAIDASNKSTDTLEKVSYGPKR